MLSPGRQTRERDRLVPQPPGLRLLALRHRCLHTDAQPELPGAVCGDRHRPRQNHLGREGVLGRFQDVSQGEIFMFRSHSYLSAHVFSVHLCVPKKWV